MTMHIVFGGAGFIGVNLINEILLDPNNNVVCIDNLSRGKFAYIEKFMVKKPMAVVTLVIRIGIKFTRILSTMASCFAMPCCMFCLSVTSK